jgi:putative addiction module killer protein
MNVVLRTVQFEKWLDGLRDRKAKTRIAIRIRRLEDDLLGDTKPVGDGVSELRLDYGPGYRLYFVRRGVIVILLLCGGDKSSQARDIVRAKEIAALHAGFGGLE